MNTTTKIALFAGANLMVTMGVVGFVALSGFDSNNVEETALGEPPEVMTENHKMDAPNVPTEKSVQLPSKDGPVISVAKSKALEEPDTADGDELAKVDDAVASGEVAPEPLDQVIEAKEEPVIEYAGANHAIIRKPNYAKLYVGGTGKTVNAFLEEGSHTLIMAGPDEVPEVTLQSYPYEGNSFRLTDHPGFCGKIAVARTRQESFMWVPDHLDPEEGVLGEIAHLVSDPVKWDLEEVDIPDHVDVGVWVVCAKRDDRVPPFYDMRILEQIDGVSLGNPTYIF